MKIQTKFDISDKVHIKELNLIARIIGIYIDASGVEFNCRYFYESKLNTCYFQESEISKEIPEKKTGFV
jgi:hypothetical protein